MLKSQIEDVLVACIDLLTVIATFDKAESAKQRGSNRKFWKQLLRKGLCTQLQVISNDVMKMEKASKSSKHLLDQLDSLPEEKNKQCLILSYLHLIFDSIIH